MLHGEDRHPGQQLVALILATASWWGQTCRCGRDQHLDPGQECTFRSDQEEPDAGGGPPGEQHWVPAW